jgi:hypothetical protein
MENIQTEINANTCLCPKCKTDWRGDDIYDKLRSMEGYSEKTDSEIVEIAERYGWSKNKPKSFSKLLSIEIQGEYDGILYYQCPKCETYWGRFSGKEVMELNNFNHKREINAKY